MRALLLCLLGGCSFIFVTSPPEHPTPQADCTESRISPAIDAVTTIGLGALAIGAMSTKSSCSSNSTDCLGADLGAGITNAAGAALLIPTLVYAISAIHGVSATGACRDLHESRPATPAKPWNPDGR